MKDKLGENIMKKIVRLRAKLTYLIDNDSEDNKEKGTIKCVIKKKFRLKIIKTVQNQLNLKIK